MPVFRAGLPAEDAGAQAVPSVDIVRPPILSCAEFAAFGSTLPPTIEEGKPSPKANFFVIWILDRWLPP